MSKVFVKGYFIQQNGEFKNKSKKKIQTILDKIKKKAKFP